MRETWNKSWNVNTTGTHILIHTFVPLLLKPLHPRLLFITSGTSTLAKSENTTTAMNKSPTKGWPKQAHAIAAYRSSKTGMNMMMREWTRILREDGVKVWCISPGFLVTGLGGEDPTLCTSFVREVIEGTRGQDVEKVVHRNGIQPW
jgi:NAD(P)-dependent dehydrogenase (short-subunit alcohol dehydrogenase family)